jgi:FXSXX-COOH protein
MDHMRSTDEASGVSSAVVDVRELSLADILNTSSLDQAVARVLPDAPVARVAVAAFNSAI